MTDAQPSDIPGDNDQEPTVQPIFRSATYDYLNQIYTLMLNGATRNDEDVEVWTGFGTELADQMKFSQPRVSQLINILIEMGCIERKKVGRRGNPSEFILVRPPDPPSYLARNRAEPLVDELKVDEIETLTDLVERVYRMERFMFAFGRDYVKRFPDSGTLGEDDADRAAEAPEHDG